MEKKNGNHEKEKPEELKFVVNEINEFDITLSDDPKQDVQVITTDVSGDPKDLSEHNKFSKFKKPMKGKA